MTIAPILRRFGAGVLIAGVICPSAEALDEPFHRLSGIEIQQEIVGHAVTDESHWLDVFAPDGARKT